MDLEAVSPLTRWLFAVAFTALAVVVVSWIARRIAS